MKPEPEFPFFLFRGQTLGAHVHVGIWVGTEQQANQQARPKAGTIVLDPHQWDALKAQLRRLVGHGPAIFDVEDLERSASEAEAARETVRTTPVGAKVRVTWTNPPDSDHPRRSCPYPDGCTGCVDTIDGTVLEVDDDSVAVAATEGTEVYTLGETFTVYAVELADGRATLEVL